MMKMALKKVTSHLKSHSEKTPPLVTPHPFLHTQLLLENRKWRWRKRWKVAVCLQRRLGIG